MANDYKDKGTWDDRDVSDADRSKILDNKAGWEREQAAYLKAKDAGDQGAMALAEAGKRHYHGLNEDIRAGYDYSGGVDGTEYLKAPKKTYDAWAYDGGGASLPTREDFTFQDAPTYTSKYESQIDSLLNDILNRDAFSYDHNTDPLYAQYAQRYQREGQRSMQDTLGSVAASTGGLASSYATTAAQQAGDYYAAKQADIIPELYQLAYGQYLDSIDGQVRDLGLLNQMDDSQYGRYRDTMGDWRDDRNFAYGQYRDNIGDDRYDFEWQYQMGRDQVADNRYDREWNYNVGRDQVADDRYQQQWDYNVGRDQIADDRYVDERDYGRQQDELNRQYTQDGTAYDRAMDKWQMLGYLDAESAKVLGLPAGTKSSDYTYQLAQLARQSASGSGGSGSGSKGSGSSGSQSGGTGVEGLYQAMMESGSPETYLAMNYQKHNVAYSMIPQVLAGYGTWAEAQNGGGQAAGGVDDSENYTITNKNGDGWVHVPGIGRVSYQELLNLVERGDVIETVNKANGTVTYAH